MPRHEAPRGEVRGFGREIRVDVSSEAKEYEHGLFPLSRVADCADWRSAYNEYWDYDKTKSKMWDAFEKDVIKRYCQSAKTRRWESVAVAQQAGAV